MPLIEGIINKTAEKALRKQNIANFIARKIYVEEDKFFGQKYQEKESKGLIQIMKLLLLLY